MPSLEAHDYVVLGRRAILELLDQQHAVVWQEAEARIADAAWPTIGHRIEPHHLSTARRDLLEAGSIAEQTAVARGRRQVTVVVSTVPRRATAIAKAAQRKRLLLTRYLGWAQGTPSRPGIVGPAAERATHASLVAAAPYGYRLLQPDGRGVVEILGTTLTGPLDNAAIYTALNDDGSPGGSVAIPIEVKNVRDWLYPSSPEPYQLLEKAAYITRNQPDVPLTPVLVCRRAHYTLYRMAKDLGFFILETHRQFILPQASEDEVIELRRELGFYDMVRDVGADDRIVRRLTHALPGYALTRSERWAATVASPLAAEFATMRATHDGTVRQNQLEFMRQLAERDLADAGLGW